jgi:predicted transcriptional regulator
MRRTKEEIIASILKICLSGSSKTVVVYQSNLNFKTVDPYLNSLMKNGLVAAMDGKYKTTDKGKELLATIKDAHEFL